jgi:hypothetical protein
MHGSPVQVHWTCSDEVTDAFSDFVEHLVSAHTVYVRQVCESVAQFFLPGMPVRISHRSHSVCKDRVAGKHASAVLPKGKDGVQEVRQCRCAYRCHLVG